MVKITWNPPPAMGDEYYIQLPDSRFLRLDKGIREYPEEAATMLRQISNPTVKWLKDNANIMIEGGNTEIKTFSMADIPSMTAVQSVAPLSPSQALGIDAVASNDFAVAGVTRNDGSNLIQGTAPAEADTQTTEFPEAMGATAQTQAADLNKMEQAKQAQGQIPDPFVERGPFNEGSPLSEEPTSEVPVAGGEVFDTGDPEEELGLIEEPVPEPEPAPKKRAVKSSRKRTTRKAKPKEE